jgi:hypothetical protein
MRGCARVTTRRASRPFLRRRPIAPAIHATVPAPFMHSNLQSWSNEYAHLSLRDLLEAREQFHLHLMRLPNVVATAVGRYRIRSSDSWPTATGGGKHRGTDRRTLENSEVRPYSWPAILVFVEKWESAEQFGPGAKYDSEEMVPKTIYLADGMRVPVCVIEAPKQAESKLAPSPVRYPLIAAGTRTFCRR